MRQALGRACSGAMRLTFALPAITMGVAAAGLPQYPERLKTGLRNENLLNTILSARIMKNSFIVTYDICEPKRLKKIFQEMRNWGNHLQYSVFECQLSTSELLQLRNKLNEIINNAEDQVLFINLGPAAGRGERVIEALGQPYVQLDAPCIVA